MTYQECLDRLFESFIKAKPDISSKYDREIRSPYRLLSFAKEKGILPSPHKVIKVTGSKGKGTTTRMISEILQAAQPDQKIALVISPEEIDHLDRMRINGVAISEADFCRLAENILSELPPLKTPEYYSPYGLFLIIALAWFNQQNVDHVVIECGRGVRYDEGGQVPSHVGVVTSIFLEHPEKLGPSLEEIRADKLSISETSNHVILASQVRGVDENFQTGDRPEWISSCQSLAYQCVEKYLGHPVEKLEIGSSASFGEIDLPNGGKVIFEAMIAPESAARIYWQKLKLRFRKHLVVYLSLPDEKNFQGIEEFYAAVDIAPQHVILTGERGNLCYDAAKKSSVFYTGDYDDEVRFREALMPQKDQVFAFVGTQTFIRLVKKAFLT